MGQIYPLFDQVEKCRCVQEDLDCFGVRGDRRPCVINLIPFSAAGIEIVGETLGRLSNRQLGSFECQATMSRNTGNSVSRASDCHLGRLECGVVRSGKAAILGEHGDRRICKVSDYEPADFCQLLNAGGVAMYPIALQQFLPTH